MPRAKKDPVLLEKQSLRFRAVAEKFDNNLLAKKLEVDTSIISRIRNGRPPTFEQILALAKFAKCPPEYLLGLKGPKGWVLDTGNPPTVMVPRLGSLEAIRKRPFKDDSIKGWVPYLVQDLERMVGAEPQLPKQFAQVPVGGGYLLVDNNFRIDHIQSNQTFVVRHRAELSICKIIVWDDQILCKEDDKIPIRVCLSPRKAMHNLLIARVLTETVYICEHQLERWR